MLFPSQLGSWQAGPHKPLEPEVERALGANDYLSLSLVQPGSGAPVDLFMAYYNNQSRGGVHSPEVCLPGAEWEIAKLERIDAPVVGGANGFTLNRAIIQNGLDRMMVYYWYDQQGARTASMFDAKLELMMSKLRNGREDSAIVRLITPIGPKETEADAEARLIESLRAVIEPLPRFVPGA
jgi:EpsI family protein